ncbi:nitrate- and nitrite sensing domain-containing protein [Labedaea rhizosphaerae]|uniref:histidine kinase n=1 Tax=Labedaea rhizosphaerae TaxID=598644 RepID=A0A4R6SN03_LABRH|nr:nitrate- and nitrite sensing domain-containing protein [Labedaea rhizosphaerae]TDQ04563.1 signal transduction histidine kinase [Labedaea rhizosphaerae]
MVADRPAGAERDEAILAARPRSVTHGLRNWRVRTKMAVVLLVPAILAIVLGGLRVQTEVQRANDYNRAVTQVELTQVTAELADKLQGERDQEVGFVAGGGRADKSPVNNQVAQTSNAILALQAERSKIGDLDPAVQRLYDAVVARLGTPATAGHPEVPGALTSFREAATTQYPAGDLIRQYNLVIAEVLQLGREITRVSDDRGVTEKADVIDAIGRAKEQMGIENSILRAAALGQTFGPGQVQALRAAQAQFTAALADFNNGATSEEREDYQNTVAGTEVDNREQLAQIALNKGDANQPTGIDIAKLDPAASGTMKKLRDVEIQQLDELHTLTKNLAKTATTSWIRDAVLIAAALVLALILMLVVTGSLLRPLRTLRRASDDLAERRLPDEVRDILRAPDPVEAAGRAVEPMPVYTTEEIGQVARSFDKVHNEAVRLAAEQALLRDNINSIFVNLSRRSQALVERQLNLIDRLEQDEQDPDQLASLFELDHLATRMRRNSESLLVLSGTGLSRQLARPVPGAEVVGAAVSEVEQYARIEVTSAPDVAVMGRAVNDLVHLIAELLDNATTFSEPEKKVVVRMAVTRKKELAIQITDQGVGMSESDIEAANARLADPPDMDVAVTRRMGLYVVARLAKRHNIVVRLRDNEDIEGGLIARITVPADLIQPMRGGGFGATGTMLPTSASTSMSMPAITGTQAPITTAFGPVDPAEPQVKTGGIADAFSGSRQRPDVPDEPRWPERTGEQPTTAMSPPPSGPSSLSMPTSAPTTGFMPLDPSDSSANIPLPKRGGRSEEQISRSAEPFSPVPTGLPEPEPPRPVEQTGDFGSLALFGEPLPLQEPEQAGPPAPPEPDPAAEAMDSPTERLPIYEAVLSQWFEADSESMNPPPAPQAATNGNGKVSTNGSGANGANGHQPTAADAADERAAAWQSPGDEGWQAAQALLNAPQEEEAKTTAGLPKRVPKAHLVPGSAAPRHTQEQRETHEEQQLRPTPQLPPRSAEAIRGRMSSFQQGLRRGRHALVEAYPGDRSGSIQSRLDEEQE